MFDLYTAVVLTTILLLIITAADAMTNRLISKRTKKLTVITCACTAISALGECIGVLTNGAPPSLIPIHQAAKFLEFCFAPAIGISAAMAYGVVKKPKIAISLAFAHAAFEGLSLFFGFVFSIDARNIYHRKSLYFIYVSAFVLSLIYCIVCVIRSGKEYHTGMDINMVLTLVLVSVGISIQFLISSIRIDFLCISIANMLLYTRRYKMVLSVDAVTHLLNRRCYDAHIANIGSRAVIIFFDINTFKNINDTYGHSTGDLCLRNIADRLRAVYGKYGSCYRIGGDEFCVIMNSRFDMPEELNKHFTNEINTLRKTDKRMPDVALGYAYYDCNKTNIQNTIEEADAMMYKNKHK